MRAAAVPVLCAPKLSGLPGVVHAFSERGGGVSPAPYTGLNLGPRSGDPFQNVAENRRRFHAAAGTLGMPVLAPRQTHSADVTVHHASDPLPAPGVVEGDGIVTDQPGVALAVLAADCLPVLLYDPHRRLVGAVHAGWRGTAGGIAARAVTVMHDAFGSDPVEIRVALGPCIGRCCYEVGPEVLTAVGAATPAHLDAIRDPLPGDAGKGMLDLLAANTAQLVGAGLRPEHIEAIGMCTACQPERFYSHRRAGEPTGRGGAVIALAVEPD